MKELTYSPQETAALTVQLVEGIKERGHLDGIPTGIPAIDEVMLPMRSSELIIVMAYASNGKTSWMNYLARQALKQCGDNECVIKCTWEQSIEEDTLYWLAHDSKIPITLMVRGLDDERWYTFMKSYERRATTPLWMVGHSSIYSEKTRKIRPRLSMNNIMQACEHIINVTDESLRIKMVLLDYLQRIRPDPADGDSLRAQMIEAVNKAKDLALALGCPVVLGAQAKRDVLGRDYKQPRIDDGGETANIEQSSQKLMSLWYPIKTEKPGSKVDGFEVTKNLLMFCLVKQTLGEAPVTIPLYFEPKTNTFGEMVKTNVI